MLNNTRVFYPLKTHDFLCQWHVGPHNRLHPHRTGSLFGVPDARLLPRGDAALLPRRSSSSLSPTPAPATGELHPRSSDRPPREHYLHPGDLHPPSRSLPPTRCSPAGHGTGGSGPGHGGFGPGHGGSSHRTGGFAPRPGGFEVGLLLVFLLFILICLGLRP